MDDVVPHVRLVQHPFDLVFQTRLLDVQMQQGGALAGERQHGGQCGHPRP